MTSIVQDWITFLQRIDPLIGVPLVIAGLSIMAFGWRTWKVWVVLSFAVVGLLTPMFFVTETSEALLYGAGAGALLGLLSFYLLNWSVPVLGGIVGGLLLTPALEGIGLRGPALWAGMGVAFACATGMAAINRRYVIILVTAFEGAVLLMSGVAAFMTSNPKFLTTFQGMAAGSVLITAFCILVPTVMSFFYQVSEVRRLGQEL